MITDKLGTFWNDQSLASTAGNKLVGDVIDLGAAKGSRDVGAGQPVYLILNVTKSATAATSTTRIQLRHAGNAALSTTPATVVDTGVLALAKLGIGDWYVYPLPSSNEEWQQFIGLWVTTATASQVALEMGAFLSIDSFGWKAKSDWR